MMRFVAYPSHVIRTQASLLLVCYCFLLVLSLCHVWCIDNDHHAEETIETIEFLDLKTKVKQQEFAFRAPMKGLPNHQIEVFCASVRMRLYWGVYRDEVKETKRKGLYLRRMARLAKHIFDDIRDTDRPFNATMLSQPDKYFGVSQDPGDEPMDESGASSVGGTSKGPKMAKVEKAKKRLSLFKTKLVNGLQRQPSGDQTAAPVSANEENNGNEDDNDDAQSNKSASETIEASEAMKELDQEGNKFAIKRIKKFIKKWAPKVALGIYTRWRTMWWMMMSCLFAKYYLWDPALDEFTKLKRNLVMWPEFQLLKMQQLSCKPLQLFKRLLDVCKVMNPLMHIDFGQLSLDKMTRFH